MPAPKTEMYTKVEQDWLELKIKQLSAYIDANPIETIDDRIETVTSSKGQPVVKIIAKREDAVKSWINALKEYANLLGAVEVLREKRAAAAAVELRGGAEMNGLMKTHLEDNDK